VWAPRRTRSTASSRLTRAPRATGSFEIVGRYNPQTDPSIIELDEDKVRSWLGKDAQPTEAVARLIKVKGIS
jgi:small subunit ribosomal protein S16